jgi:predicted secreted protein
MLSETYANVLLRPKETRTIPFLVQIDRQLDDHYKYTFPFRLSSRLGESETVEIKVVPNGPVLGASDFSELIEQYAQASAKSAPFGVACARAIAYVGASATHRCAVDGNVPRNLRVCHDGACEQVAMQDGSFTLTTTSGAEGIHTTVYTASSGQDQASFLVTSQALAQTKISIAIEAPAQATTGDDVPITIELSAAGAQPHSLDVTLRTGRTSATQTIDSVPAKVRFKLPARALRPGENTIDVTVAYTDELGTQGSSSAQATIELTNVGVFDRVAFALEDAAAWIAGLLS